MMRNMNDIQKMMKQAQKMQESLLEVQEKLGDQEVEGTSGGGAVKITMTGKHAIKSVKLSAEAVDPEDIETLEDLLVTAFNDALNNANKLANDQMGSVTGGMNLPGIGNIGNLF